MKRRRVEEFHWVLLKSLNIYIVKPLGLKRSNVGCPSFSAFQPPCFLSLHTQRTKRPRKRGHIVADTLLLMSFLVLRKLGNICCGHKMFLNKIRNNFVSRTQDLCPQQMLPARANGETLVSATMCPQQCVLVCQGLNRKRDYW